MYDEKLTMLSNVLSVFHLVLKYSCVLGFLLPLFSLSTILLSQCCKKGNNSNKAGRNRSGSRLTATSLTSKKIVTPPSSQDQADKKGGVKPLPTPSKEASEMPKDASRMAKKVTESKESVALDPVEKKSLSPKDEAKEKDDPKTSNLQQSKTPGAKDKNKENKDPANQQPSKMSNVSNRSVLKAKSVTNTAIIKPTSPEKSKEDAEPKEGGEEEGNNEIEESNQERTERIEYKENDDTATNTNADNQTVKKEVGKNFEAGVLKAMAVKGS